MKYCSHCGKELLDEAVVCTNCGCPAKTNVPPRYAPEPGYTGLSIAGVVLAFLFPLIGLIVSIIAQNDARNSGNFKSAGLAKVGIIISAVFIGIAVLFWALILGLLGASSCAYIY